MNKIKSLALRVAAATGMLGVYASNVLAQAGYPLDVTPVTGIDNPTLLKDKIISITTVFVGFITVIAAILLIYGAYLYITAGANEDNAKKGKTAIVYAIIGILIAAAVYIITNVAGSLIGSA
ncbi:MAG: hypothetical protein HYT38_01120 [Candidatus Sungbacteria bacterium]|uniref:DUF4134 domain-containing protein n=1 Tax=Candidatus Sungiibacteriota bacterium TaxID=2750080 RepID=A0A931YE30_9BACT|nr:hypothetical protein [Candidatus Sungbacteria bacterium]MBI2466162.1 hypothetical protein [Candidatus Sungbacteria bacterium]